MIDDEMLTGRKVKSVEIDKQKDTLTERNMDRNAKKQRKMNKQRNEIPEE